MGEFPKLLIRNGGTNRKKVIMEGSNMCFLISSMAITAFPGAQQFAGICFFVIALLNFLISPSVNVSAG